MSSILTNTSSMVALQTLKGINSNLQKVQSEISTGKSVNSAKDNAALWAISKVMESDVAGFKAVKESLALGESSVAVARNASETVTDLLTDIKSKVIAAQESNVDREKIQTDIRQLTDQIQAVTGAAQFNGLNLVQGQEDVDVLASLDRGASGSVASNSITVERQDLTFDKGSYNTGTANLGSLDSTTGADFGAVDGTETDGNLTLRLGGGMAADDNTDVGAAFEGGSNDMLVTVAGTIGNSEKMDVTIAGTTVSYTTAATGTVNAQAVADGFVAAINAAGIEDISVTAGTNSFTINSTSQFEDVSVTFASPGATFELDSGAADGSLTEGTAAANASGTIQSRATDIEFSAVNPVNDGDGYRVSFGGVNYDYVAGKGETFEDVAKGLKTVIDGAVLSGIETKVVQDSTSGAWSLQIDNAGAAMDIKVEGISGGTASGGLLGLDTLDVTTNESAKAALENIETLIQSSIDAAAEFGSVAGRIETQSEFISNLTDSLKSGIGTLVDADMEEASARLQALQVQQQLGVQSLSIANQAPQSLLSLFR